MLRTTSATQSSLNSDLYHEKNNQSLNLQFNLFRLIKIGSTDSLTIAKSIFKEKKMNVMYIDTYMKNPNDVNLKNLKEYIFDTKPKQLPFKDSDH